MDREKISAINISDKRIISRKYKELLFRRQPNEKKMSKIFERTILKRRYMNDQQAYEKLLSIFGHYGKLKPLHT